MAKDAAMARFLQEQQSAGTIHKTYLALVHGRFPDGPLKAQGWLVQDQDSQVRKKRRFLADLGVFEPAQADQTRQALPGAETCATLFEGIGSWKSADGFRSLVEARLITGRTHQIRASLSALGYPIVGDKLYGLDEGFFLRFMDNTLTAEDEERLVLPYQALHCAGLEFQGPEGTRLVFSTPAPWAERVKLPLPGAGTRVRQ
jgi:23S rRNA-/tRNA-specific pseudouridylate synthase